MVVQNLDKVCTPNMAQPFTEARVTFIEGDQRGGKSCYAVGTIINAYDSDCVRLYCENVLKIKCEPKDYYRKDRVAKILFNEQTKYIKIPETYKLYTPLQVFSNIHLFGLRYIYIPSFKHLLTWLKSGFVSNGILLVDESHRGMSARGSMTSMGKDFMAEYFQFGKSHLEVLLISHLSRLIDFAARSIPTKHVHCSYDKKTKMVHVVLKCKGENGSREYDFDATRYWGNYWTDEKVLE